MKRKKQQQPLRLYSRYKLADGHHQQEENRIEGKLTGTLGPTPLLLGFAQSGPTLLSNIPREMGAAALEAPK